MIGDLLFIGFENLPITDSPLWRYFDCLRVSNGWGTKVFMVTVDGKQIEWQAGMTLTRLLDALKENQHVAVVRLDGKLVSLPNFADTTVPDGAVIEVIPLVAGG